MMDRAYTEVHRGQSRVGNRWIERTWSTFVGHTTSLLDVSEGLEWTAGLSREFSVRIDGEPLGVMDFGEVEWSEENGPVGAALTSRKKRPGLEILTHTLALHEFPALVRTLTLHNLSRHDVVASHIVLDSLGLVHEGVRVFTDGFAMQRDAIEWRTDERAAALTRDQTVLILGSEAPCTFRLYAPEAGVFAVMHEGSQQAPGGAKITFPATYLLAASGDPAECARTVFADFLVRLRAMRRSAPATG